MLCCRQRPSNIDASEGALEELVRIVAQIRDAWPEVRILVRGDSGFCREAIMAWCEATAVDYVFGVARDARLVRKIARQMRRSRRRCVTTGRFRLALSSVHPRQYLFGHVALALRRAAAADPAPHRSHRALAGPASAELCLKPLPTADDSVLFSRLAVRGSLKCCRRGTYPRNPRRKPKNAARFNARRCNRRLGELSGLELSLV